MNWLSILLYLLLHVSDFIAIIKQLINIFSGLPKDGRLEIKAQLQTAIQAHKETGDDAALKRACEGIGCPTDLK